MAIIFQPDPGLLLLRTPTQSFIRAGTLAALDFVAGTNKPWSYYLGVGLGDLAAATGIPNASVTLWAIGQSVDLTFFQSPDGSLADVFVDGLLVSSVDNYATSAVWSVLNIPNLIDGQLSQVTIVNRDNPNVDKSSSINWMALGPITVNGANPQLRSPVQMAYNTLAYRITDSETDSREATVPVYVPQGLQLVDYQEFSDLIAPEIDAVSGGQLTSVSITIELTLPGGLKASPTAGILNERGGLISFDTTGPRRDSVRIPAMNTTIMSGDSFSLADTAVDALITRMTTDTTTTTNSAVVRPRTAQDYLFSAGVVGKKSFRK